ncbi:hypothetical protein OROHE_000678 [Orobanche hederae]
MTQKTPAQSQPHHQKKNSYCVMEDIHGVIMVPKEESHLQRQLHPPSHCDLRMRVPDLRLALQDLMKTIEVGEFLSGALAGAMTKAILAPLETIRTRMVVGVGSKHIRGSFFQIIEQQGWQGLWAGNAINMLRIVPTQAIELGTFEYVKRAVMSAQEKWKLTGSPRLDIGRNLGLSFSLSWLSPVAVAGAAAGVVSTLACHPLEVLKDRLTVSPDIYPNLSIAVRKMCSDGGIGAACSLTAHVTTSCTRQ